MLRQHMLRPQLLLDGKWGADCTLPVKPVFSNAVTVVCCGDEFFAAPTGVLFRTIIDRASPQRCYDLLYLHNGIREETKTKLCSIARGRDNISIRTCDIRPMFSENGLYVENRENFSTMSIARLITADVLDGSYKRAVYLDGDMIAFRDVAELYDSDLGGKPLGSSIDFNISVQDRRRGNREEIERVEYTRKVLGLSRMEDYIICGMLVMDLDRLRKDYPAAELVKTARSRKWLLHDQDVINHVFRGNIQMLDPAWDGHIRDRDAAMLDEELFNSWKRAEENPFIFHFAGMGTKPWEACCLKYEAEFWQAAGRTAFFAQLIRRKMVRLDTYNTFYSPKGYDIPMIKRFLKKILPPPVESFQRDLKVILDSIDRQKQLSFMLMQQMDELSLSREGDAASAGKACAHVPLLPSGLPQRNDPLGAEQPQQGRVGLRKPKN